MKRKQIVIAYIQICCIYENKHIHTYILTQMILVSLLCIQASMLSYPILLRWVNTPIEQQVSLVVSMPIHSTYIHTPTYIHEMAAADTVDTANLTRISQRVHDHIHIFKWCMWETRSVLIIWYSTFVRMGIKKQMKLNFHPRTITWTIPSNYLQ